MFDGGSSAQSQWQEQLNQMKDPAGYYNNIISKYMSSPMAQQQIAGSLGASAESQAASGIAGSPALTAALKGTAATAAQKGRENYLNATLQRGSQVLSANQIAAGQTEQQRQAKAKQDASNKSSTMETIGTVAAIAMML